MPLVDTYGTLAGTGDITTTGLVALYDLSGDLPGTGDLTGTLVWWNDFDGSVSGAGDVTSSLAAYMPLGGTLDGAGDVAGSPTYWLIFGGTLSGLASVSTPSPILIFLVGGQAIGFGTIYDELLQDIAGVMQGVGGLTGALIVSSALPPGYLAGLGNIAESVPLPLLGVGNLAAYVEVVRPPGPVCPCHEPPVPTFGYLQTLGKNDLTLCITDGFGNNYSPSCVTYALYEIMPGGYRQLRGPPARRPVMTFCGCYYATGAAGECGQPGNWCIVWSWQRAAGFPTECRTDFFQVQDAAMANPCDPARKRKFGWGC